MSSKLQKENKTAKRSDSFHHRGLGFIDSDSLSTSVLKWEQRALPECDTGGNTAEACARQKPPPPPPGCLLKKKPTAFIWLKALTAGKALTCGCYAIQAGEVFNLTLAEKATLSHSCCTAAVEIQASSYLSMFLTSSSITLKLVGRQKPNRLHFTGSKTNFKIVAKATGEQIWSHLD